MEGVGARFGRSSTRYGPTSTVFTGPVRKWKKKWIHVAPPNNATSPSSNHKYNNSSNNPINGTVNGSNGNNGGSSQSHLLFYKWAPLPNVKEDEDQENDVVQEPLRRKFRYIPVAVLEEQQNEATENEAGENETVEKVEEEAKADIANPDVVDPTPKNDSLDEKPDINDVPMDENEEADDTPSTRQDLNVNLGFNLNSNDGDPESDNNTDEK